jgi:hypothetical protein
MSGLLFRSTCVQPSFRGGRVVQTFVLYLVLVCALYCMSFLDLRYLGTPFGIFKLFLYHYGCFYCQSLTFLNFHFNFYFNFNFFKLFTCL